MIKTFLLFILIIIFGKYEYQDPINKFDITGKWYVKETINMDNNDTLNITFIKCPYFDFNPNRMFYSENGMNVGSDNITWSLLDSNIIFIDRSFTPNDTIIFKIFNYEKDKMSIHIENVKINLDRICIEN